MRAFCLAAGVIFASAAALTAQPVPWTEEFPQTDFSRSTVDLDEIRDVGPSRDEILAISDPGFVPMSEARAIPGVEPVLTLEIAGAVPRAYPLRYLTWHVIVNDMVDGVPVAVTFGLLANSAITFDRRVEGAILTFGVSGKVRKSNTVMYDRETESWWQQSVGEGIVGRYAGSDLTMIPTWVESLDQFAERNPEGLVMAEPDIARDYSRTSLPFYDTRPEPLHFDGNRPPHGIDPLARVVRVGDRAWPLARLAAAGEIVEAGLTLTWRAGQASALDTSVIAEARDIGMVRVRDAQGHDVVHDVLFAVAFHAFWPEGRWMLAP
ncbi:MAG: DUF3179 domain-containing protein [Pseudomonadota bacterium]